MATTTTYYSLLKPAATDSYNHLVYDNPNMDTIDATMKANSDAAITSATCIKSGTTHTIVRSNTDAPVFRFTATGDWNAGDTMIVDGVTVTPYQVDGTALLNGAYIINTEVMAIISGSRVTVLSNTVSAQGVPYASGTSIADLAEAIETSIVNLESNPSTRAYSIGNHLMYNGTRYKAIIPINVGDSLVVGTNITAESVENNLITNEGFTKIKLGFGSVTVSSLAQYGEANVQVTGLTDYIGGYCFLFLISSGDNYTVQNGIVQNNGAADCYIRNVRNATQSGTVTYAYLVMK